MKRLSFYLFFLLFCSNLSASIVYVSPAGDGMMDGTSWSDAFPGISLQIAINGAVAGDSIWVAAGTYFPTTSGDRSVRFSMRNNITILGSFQGNETSFEERTLSCGPSSILSGNIGDTNVSTDNSYTIIVNYDLDNTAILDGFEIREGYDNRSVSSIENGLAGGVYNGGNGNGGLCSPTYRNCVIVQNFATFGAGMFNNGYSGGNSEPILENCIIAFNTATIGGGGMDSYGWNNGNASPTLVNCVMYGNISNDRAGAIYCWGGLNGNCTTSIINSAIINNSADNIAGGIIVDNSNNSAGTSFSGIAEVLVKNSIFWGNTALEGPQFFILGTGHLNATYSNIDTVNQLPAHPISGPGTGNIFTDPLLQNALNAIGVDACWMTSDDGLNLQINAPGINTGDGMIDNDLDIKRDPRISGISIDMGPYEFSLADTVLWTGTINSEWLQAENWSPARIPDSLQTTVIPSSLIAPNQPVIDMEIYCKSLLLNTGSMMQILETGELIILDK